MPNVTISQALASALRLAGIVLIASGCADELAMYESQGPRYEARSWLASTGNHSPFASNRFETRAAAAAFIDTLYNTGADTVFVLNVQVDSAMLADEGGPYADALLVKLPSDTPKRAALFAIAAREARREGFEPDRDRGSRYLYVWWD
jgi:hypothetical protein